MQSSEPYKDLLDQLQFPESPSPGDNDYKSDGDDYQDDYDCEPNEDDNKVSEDGVYDHNVSTMPRPNGQKRARSNSMDADNNDEWRTHENGEVIDNMVHTLLIFCSDHMLWFPSLW
jgi:hypothetical protein